MQEELLYMLGLLTACIPVAGREAVSRHHQATGLALGMAQHYLEGLKELLEVDERGVRAVPSRCPWIHHSIRRGYT